jgi:hypothetical protein
VVRRELDGRREAKVSRIHGLNWTKAVYGSNSFNLDAEPMILHLHAEYVHFNEISLCAPVVPVTLTRGRHVVMSALSRCMLVTGSPNQKQPQHTGTGTRSRMERKPLNWNCGVVVHNIYPCYQIAPGKSGESFDLKMLNQRKWLLGTNCESDILYSILLAFTAVCKSNGTQQLWESVYVSET